MSRRCPRPCLVTVEAGCQEEAQKKKAEKKERQRRKVERQVRNEVAQEVVAGVKKKTRTHEDAKPTVHRTAGQRVEQNLDCSQIENEEEEEDEDWQKGEQLERKEVLCRQK